MHNIIIRDNKGRTILETKNGRCLLSRFVDMESKTKEDIIELYVDLTGDSPEKAKKFLNFESEEQEFCS